MLEIREVNRLEDAPRGVGLKVALSGGVSWDRTVRFEYKLGSMSRHRRVLAFDRGVRNRHLAAHAHRVGSDDDSRLAQPLDKVFDFVRVLVRQHPAPVLQRIVGVDSL
jgi:hypothetical protein